MTAQRQPLRAVTLNTWKGDGAYRARLAATCRGLTALRPHIVLVQEALRASALDLDTTSTLAGALGMAAEFLPLRRKIRMVEGVPTDCWSGLGVLSQLPILGTRAVPLPDDPRDGERAAQIVALAVGGCRLTIANLHLTHLTDADALRRDQLHRVAEELDRESRHDRILVGGDFNAEVSQLGLEGIGIGDGRLADVRRSLGIAAEPTVAGDPRCIDHFLCLAGGPVHPKALAAAWIEGTVPASDHAAVVLDFTA